MKYTYHCYITHFLKAFVKQIDQILMITCDILLNYTYWIQNYGPVLTYIYEQISYILEK